jgi:polar amino acid transport system permease protein
MKKSEAESRPAVGRDRYRPGLSLRRALFPRSQRLSEMLDEHAPDDLSIRARPVPRPSRWVATAVVAVLVAMLIHGLVTNGAFGWGVVGQYFFSPIILAGVRLTIILTVVSMAFGIVIGILIAVMRMSQNPLMANASRLYIWFFRGTPLLVQLLFWYNIGALYPKLSIGIPFGPSFASFSANHVLTSLVAALVGLSLNEGAYMAEIVRAGILSVDAGQTEAARATGMHHRLLMRRIILPQAMRVVIPPTGNQVITMLKSTSLVSVIAIAELLYSAEIIYDRNFETIPLLIVASLWYLLMTTVLSIGQMYLERHFGRGQVTMLSLMGQHRGR